MTGRLLNPAYLALIWTCAAFTQLHAQEVSAPWKPSTGSYESDGAVPVVSSLPKPGYPVAASTSGTIIMVTSDADTGDGTLRKAIEQANENPGVDTILFNVSSPNPVIVPLTPLPAVTDPVVIDGTSQPGYSTHPVIEIMPPSAAQYPGLVITAGSSVVRGLAIGYALPAILLQRVGGNVIEGCYIGLNGPGTELRQNPLDGIQIDTSGGNRIGGRLPSQRNVISGCKQHGIMIRYSANNWVAGNFIGTDPTGTLPIPNGFDGVRLNTQASYNVIGDSIADGRNVLSGNDSSGVNIYTQFAFGNLVIGNFIGTDVRGLHPLPNGRDGVRLYSSDFFGTPSFNTVGGKRPAKQNVISGNVRHGIWLRGKNQAGGYGNTITGNLIGTDASGAAAVPNGGNGIMIECAPAAAVAVQLTTIGGSKPEDGNVISGNGGSGIFLQGDSLRSTRIVNNLIGVISGSSGYTKLGNHGDGLAAINTFFTTVGDLSGTGNMIGGNGQNGVRLNSKFRFLSPGATVRLNSIGTDGTATVDLGNAGNGILIEGTNDVIGGIPHGGNNIWYNGGAGVYHAGHDSVIAVVIRYNSINSNGGLGIDLAPPGPNPNDSLDADTGANGRQNFPVIDSVIDDLSGSSTLFGHIDSKPNGNYAIDAYWSPTADPSGYGEGAHFLSERNVTADASGHGSFAIPVIVTFAGKAPSLTATDNGTGGTSEFSLSPVQITIRRPRVNDLVITGVRDSIEWDGFGGIPTVDILFNDGLPGSSWENIATNIPFGQKKFYWDVPEIYVSHQAKIRLQGSAAPAVFGTSDTFRIRPLALVNQRENGGYELYVPALHGWSFPNDSAAVWPAAWYNQFRYDTTADPFTQRQYRNDFWAYPPRTFTDWPVFVQAFGVDSCYSRITPTSTQLHYRNAAVQKWKGLVHPWNGSCYGFVVTSLLAFTGKDAFVQDFGLPAFDALSSLPVTPESREAINRAYNYQYGADQIQRDENAYLSSPVFALLDLKEIFSSDTPDPCVLAMHNIGGHGGGHAVVPYEIDADPNNPDLMYIKVYDSNYPGSDIPCVTVNTKVGSWTYNGLPGWGGGLGCYLELPISASRKHPKLSASTPLHVPRIARTAQISGALEVYTPGAGTVLFHNSTGQTIGYQDSVVGGFANAVPIFDKSGNPGPPLGYILPSDAYDLELTPNGSNAGVYFFTDSVIASYSRQDASPTQSDGISWNAGLRIANRDHSPKRADFTFLVREPGSEKMFHIIHHGLSPVDSTGSWLTDHDRLLLDNPGDSTSYDLYLDYLTAEGEQEFSHAHIHQPANSSHTISPSWPTLGQDALAIAIDYGRDGTIDDVQYFNNQIVEGVKGSETIHELPKEFGIEQNYPNPFNPSTTIRYQLPRAAHVTLRVYSVIGQLVATVVDENENAGVYTVRFDAAKLASGMYFYKIQAGNFVQTRKMVVVK